MSKVPVDPNKLLPIYDNAAPTDDGDDDFDPADALSDDEREKLRKGNPQLDQILSDEQSFVDGLWAALNPEDEDEDNGEDEDEDEDENEE